MVKFLNYQGEKLPIRVSYFALKMLKEKHGKSLEQMKETDYESYEALLFYALQKGHKMEGVPFTFEMKDMEDVMDEVFVEFMQVIPLFFAQADPAKPGKK